MITKEQAYDVALNSLNSVWEAISKCANAWARAPGMNLRVATTTAQASLTTAAKNIRSVSNQLARGSVERDLLEDIAVRLDAFKSYLIIGRGMEPIENVNELVSAWRSSIQGMIDDLVARIPKIAEVPAFRVIARKLAA